MNAPPLVGAVGTTHPWNVAGLGRDLMLLHELGALPLAIVTAVSAQRPEMQARWFALPPAAIDAQFDAVADAPIAAFRVGALLDAASVERVAAGLARFPRAHVVVDPVLRTSDGSDVGGAEVRAALVRLLGPRADLLTPNLPEAEALLETRIDGGAAMEEAARALRERSGARAVLLKGGHAEGALVDVLATRQGLERFEGERLAGTLRGSGCLLAAALAFALARGDALADAVCFARALVAEKWIGAIEVGGMRAPRPSRDV